MSVIGTGIEVAILEGQTVGSTPRVAGAAPGQRCLAILTGPNGVVRFDDTLLSKHLLFLGSIGSGKTNAMMHVTRELRETAGPDDVFIVFDTKGDYLAELFRGDDVVLSNQREPPLGGRIWNMFSDLLSADLDERGDEIFEIASTIFAEQLDSAGENIFFAAGARDVFAAVVDAMAREGVDHSNDSLRRRIETSPEELVDLISRYEDLAGARHYLIGEGNAPKAVMAFLQQSVRAAFSAHFECPAIFQ